MKKIGSKILSLVLAAVLVLGMAPMTAHAEETPDASGHTPHNICVNSDVCDENCTNPDHAPTDVEWVECGPGEKYLDSGYYYISKEADTSNYQYVYLVIKEGATVVLCLNGVEVNPASIFVRNNATLIICDCSEGEVGSLRLDEGVQFTGNTSGSFSLYSGKLHGSGLVLDVEKGIDHYINIYGGVMESTNIHTVYAQTQARGKLNVAGGKILCDEASAICITNAFFDINISGGEIRGDIGVWSDMGSNLTISGSPVIATNRPREGAAIAFQGTMEFEGSPTIIGPISLSGKSHVIDETNIQMTGPLEKETNILVDMAFHKILALDWAEHMPDVTDPLEIRKYFWSKTHGFYVNKDGDLQRGPIRDVSNIDSVYIKERVDQASVDFTIPRDSYLMGETTSNVIVYSDADYTNVSTAIKAEMKYDNQDEDILTLSAIESGKGLPVGTYYVKIEAQEVEPSETTELYLDTYFMIEIKDPVTDPIVLQGNGIFEADENSTEGSFDLQKNPDFTEVRIYESKDATTVSQDVIGEITNKKLTIKKTDGTLPTGKYYVALWKDGKLESERVEVFIVGAGAGATITGIPENGQLEYGKTYILTATTTEQNVSKWNWSAGDYGNYVKFTETETPGVVKVTVTGVTSYYNFDITATYVTDKKTGSGKASVKTVEGNYTIKFKDMHLGVGEKAPLWDAIYDGSEGLAEGHSIVKSDAFPSISIYYYDSESGYTTSSGYGIIGGQYVVQDVYGIKVVDENGADVTNNYNRPTIQSGTLTVDALPAPEVIPSVSSPESGKLEIKNTSGEALNLGYKVVNEKNKTVVDWKELPLAVDGSEIVSGLYKGTYTVYFCDKDAMVQITEGKYAVSDVSAKPADPVEVDGEAAPTIEVRPTVTTSPGRLTVLNSTDKMFYCKIEAPDGSIITNDGYNNGWAFMYTYDYVVENGGYSGYYVDRSGLPAGDYTVYFCYADEDNYRVPDTDLVVDEVHTVEAMKAPTLEQAPTVTSPSAGKLMISNRSNNYFYYRITDENNKVVYNWEFIYGGDSSQFFPLDGGTYTVEFCFREAFNGNYTDPNLILPVTVDVAEIEYMPGSYDEEKDEYTIDFKYGPNIFIISSLNNSGKAYYTYDYNTWYKLPDTTTEKVVVINSTPSVVKPVVFESREDYEDQFKLSVTFRNVSIEEVNLGYGDDVMTIDGNVTIEELTYRGDLEIVGNGTADTFNVNDVYVSNYNSGSGTLILSGLDNLTITGDYQPIRAIKDIIIRNVKNFSIIGTGSYGIDANGNVKFENSYGVISIPEDAYYSAINAGGTISVVSGNAIIESGLNEAGATEITANDDDTITKDLIGKYFAIIKGESAPEITGQPEGDTVKVGGKVTLSVEVTGDDLVFKWQEKVGNEWKYIEGANAATYEVSKFDTCGKEYIYRCEVSNESGTVYSDECKVFVAHTLTKVTANDATCTTAGNIEHHKCTVENCGAIFTDAEGKNETTEANVKIDALKHDMSDATCTEAKKCKRTNCNYTEGTALGHDMSDATCTTAATCKRTDCDHTEGTALGHDMSAATCTEAKKCKRTGCDHTEGTALGHDMSEATCTTAATCKRTDCNHTEGTPLGHVDANKDKVCDVCGVKLHDHKLIKVDGVAATCTTPGSKEYYKCSVENCTELFADAAGKTPTTLEAIKIAALGHIDADKNEVCDVCKADLHKHVLTKVPAVAATCTTAGNKEYYKCNCGKLFADAEGKTATTLEAVKVAATGHTDKDGDMVCDVCKAELHKHVLVKVPGKAATCTTPGSKEYYKCTVENCTELFADAEGKTATTLEATKIAAHGHDWSGEWTVTKEATATEEGKKETLCERDCGQKKVVIIPKLGVTDDNGNLDKDAEIEPGAPVKEATLNNSKNELIGAGNIFTKEDKEAIERGEDARVWIEITKTDETTIKDEDKSKVEEEVTEIMGENATVTYFDVDLFKQVGNGEKEDIAKPGVAIKITIAIPEELLNHDVTMEREYKIVRLHTEGDVSEVDVISGEFNAETGEFSFETDRFSTYAIAYNDTSVEVDVPNTGENVFVTYSYVLLLISGLGLFFRARKAK